jgi:hypothetical protein
MKNLDASKSLSDDIVSGPGVHQVQDVASIWHASASAHAGHWAGAGQGTRKPAVGFGTLDFFADPFSDLVA